MFFNGNSKYEPKVCNPHGLVMKGFSCCCKWYKLSYAFSIITKQSYKYNKNCWAEIKK